MTDVILSSFISLFALFGKVEQVDEQRAKKMLVNYLRHHFGIRNTDLYVDLYSDMRMAYEMTENLNTIDTVTAICSNLQTDIRNTEKALLLLRLLEFCTDDDGFTDVMFKTMAEQFNISDEQYNNFMDFVNNKATEHVMLHQLEGFEGTLKTLLDPATGLLLFTYMGNDTVHPVPTRYGYRAAYSRARAANLSIIRLSSVAMNILTAKCRLSSSADETLISASPTATMACTT